MQSLPRDNVIRVQPGWLAAGAWALCCVVMLWLFNGSFATLDFRDPDDAMRLAQVRDWIGGQSWFDVTQYRVNPPTGGPMHWSRIVDLPIAAFILILRPLIGAANGEITACIMVPLLLLGALTGALYRGADRIGGKSVALVSVALLLTNPSILVQFTPLRIDHHGWQILMAAIALAAMLDPRPIRGGIVAAIALATWLQISSEGLPYAALVAGVLALRQLVDPRETPRCIAYAATLGLGALALLIMLRGFDALWTPHCDALSYVYIWPLVGLSIANLALAHLLGRGTLVQRLMLPVVGGSCAVALFLLTAGPCLSGDPFATLGPLAYRHWYMLVMEGRPVWEQGLSMAGVILLPAVTGLIGSLCAARRGDDATARRNWLMLALLLSGAIAVSIMVMRAMGVAHMLALPGIAWLLIALFRKVQASPAAIVRVLGSVALAVVTPVGMAAMWISLTNGQDTQADTPQTSCWSARTLAPLNALPPALLFAPLDMGPDLLVQTRHAVTGTGHHRNAIGISAVITGFMADPTVAQQVIGRLNGGRGATYVVSCASIKEMTHYAKDAPNGLAAMLARGQTPSWLTPIPMPGPLKLYRVLPGVKRNATPFMQ